MSPGGFHHYLPAYMTAAFDDLNIRDFLLSALTLFDPARNPQDREIAERFTPAQHRAVRAFLELMRDTASSELVRTFWSRPLETYWGRERE